MYWILGAALSALHRSFHVSTQPLGSRYCFPSLWRRRQKVAGTVNATFPVQALASTPNLMCLVTITLAAFQLANPL